MMLRRSKSPTKPAPSAWGSSAAGTSSSRPPSPTRPGSNHYSHGPQAAATASTLQFHNQVYVDGLGMRAAPHHTTTDATTKVDFWDVLVEDDAHQTAATTLLPWLGSIITDQESPASAEEDGQQGGHSEEGFPRSASSGSINAIDNAHQRQHSSMAIGPSSSSSAAASAGNPSRFDSMLAELVSTERSYVRRLNVLYNSYAQPLRQSARDRETAIIPLYEAQRLFGNVGELLGANTAFLREMEAVIQGDLGNLEALRARIGDLMHNHMACFSCYNEYFNNFEKAKHIEQTMTKTNRAFRDFADHVKHSSSNLGNVSIRELIMEPVQRIPRYKMFLDGLIKALPPQYQAQRARLESAVVVCSHIANCEIDEKTQRAAVLWSFGRNVQGFPAGLFSVHRRFIDAIDVDDFPVDAGSLAATMDPGLFSPMSTSSRAVPCTLFLFDDAVLVAKRNNPHLSGRQLLGLDNLDRLADEMKTFTEKSGASSSQQSRKGELSFRGVSDIMDVTATDLGGPDLQLYFKKEPAHIHHEKWTNRPLRQYTVLADARSESPPRFEKLRFIENLWRARALHKARDRRSLLRSMVIPATSLGGNESPGGVDAEPRRVVYWTVYNSRSTYQEEANRTAVLLHYDARESSRAGPGKALEFAGHYAQLRLHSIDEEYGECNYSVHIRNQPDDDDEYVLPLRDLAKRMRRLHDSLMLPEDHLNASNLRPTEASSASHRGRMAAGLESFGRSLFSGTPESIRFGSPRRKGSILSKSSVATSLASDLFSNSGRSVSTAGTSVNSRDMLSMASRGPAVDGQGKLLPPGSQSPRASTGRHQRAISAGTIDMVMSTHAEATQTSSQRQRPMSVALTANAETPIADLSLTGGSLARRVRASSVGDATTETSSQPVVDQNMARQRVSTRPSGPRAVPSTSPRRKAVPAFPESNSNIPYTPTRRVPSASKRSAPVDDDDDDDAENNSVRPGSTDHPETKGTADARSRASKRTAYNQTYSDGNDAPSLPEKDTVSPLQPRKKAVQQQRSSGTHNGAAAPSSTRRPLALAMKGRVHRHLARLDEADKENLDCLTGLAGEVSELHGAASELDSPLLGDLVHRMETWIADTSDRFVDSKASISRVAGDVEVLLQRLEEYERELEDGGGQEETTETAAAAAAAMKRVQELEAKVKESSVYRTRCEALQRKCELLTALEKDGRLENGELHKAFNEELDRMYDDAQLSSRDEEVRALREEVKKTKATRNDLQKRNWDLERDSKVQKGQIESYEKILRQHGLL